MTDNRPRETGTLFVRADADSNMGTGHVMRCIALAQAWRRQGGKVVFIGCGMADSLLKRIDTEGFAFKQLSASYPEQSDFLETQQIIAAFSSDVDNDWLVIDGYHFDLNYYSSLSSIGIGIASLDDNHHLPFYTAHAILNPNLYGPDINYRCAPDTLLLLGGDYSLLRSEFKRWHGWRRTIAEEAKRIFVILGGGDSENVTLKVFDALNLLPGIGITVKAVVGHANPNLKILTRAANHSPFNVELIPSVEDMPSLMAWADISVTAAGQTCLELASMGTPAITIVTAGNQETAAAIFEEKEIFDTMGWWNSFSIDKLSDKILALMENRSLRERRSERGRHAVSALGAENCVSALLNQKLIKRKCLDTPVVGDIQNR